MKFKLPNSGSKWFVPLHMCIMIVIALFIFYINTAEAGENGFADERVCLAKNIYFESANQPDAGRVAVAQVVLNRVEDLQFPNSICEVVYQAKTRTNWKGEEVPILNKCQFSWFCDGKSDEPTDSITWMQSIRIADQVMFDLNFDLTEGALYYHTIQIDPYWNDYLTPTVIINDHIFYK